MDYLEEYKILAQKNGYEFESMQDNRKLIQPSDRILNTKYCVLSKNSMVYFASDSYAAKAGMTSTYAGVYTVVSSNTPEFIAEITKRFWMDFISGKKRVKTGNSYLDKHLAISANNVELLLKMVDIRLAETYLKLWSKYAPIKIVVGVDYIPISAFKDKMVIGIEMDSWISPLNFLATYDELQEIVLSMVQRID